MIEAISHRGSTRKHAENTVGAVLAAVEDGADGVEVDVHATRDGVVVVHHDFFPRGAATDRRLAARPIADLTFPELEQFDLGGGQRVPKLADVIAALAGRATLYVEIKGRGCESQVAAVIRGVGAVAVHAFDHRAIQRMSRLAPDLRLGALQGSYMVDNCAALATTGATDLWQHFELVDAELVRDVHGCGGRVIAWTADHERDWQRLAEAGVDAICTNHVERLVAWRSGRHQL